MTHVLIVGAGGREHVLAWKLAQSPRVSRISVAPGNGGTASLAHNVPIDATDVVSLLDFAETEGVDLTVVGPEEPLVGGLVDQFEAVGLRIFGPHHQAALIGESKSYAKQLMIQHGIPTAPYELFTDLDQAVDYLYTHPVEDLVIKADGMARGKGVFFPKGESDAEGILRSLLHRDALGHAGRKVIIEQRLIGEELSIMAFADSRTIAMMPAVRNHKRLYNRDSGPGTSGMGSYAPAPALTPDLIEQVRTQIVEPVLSGLQEERCCFRGVLYVGVVLTEDGPMALELNVRADDPGVHVVLPLLETDLLDVIEACVDDRLDQLDVRWRPGAAAAIVLATASYPERNDPGLPVSLPDSLPDGVFLFHAGTRLAEDGTLVTSGGRVIGVTGVGPDLPAAILRAYQAVPLVHFDGVHYRTDIGARVLRSR
jgi:phosphoribosylamine--glycine ligase